MSIERRDQERFSLNLQARISYRHIKEQAPEIVTESANISSGGIFVKTGHKFPISSKVRIELYLSLEDLRKLKFILSMESLKQLTTPKFWVSTTGIVIRQEEDGVGIIFDTDYQLTPMHSPDSQV